MLLRVVLLAPILWGAGGCMFIHRLGTDPTGHEYGQTYYLGGAGTLGNIGTIDVPNGLRRAGYKGAIEVVGWQSILGGTLRDQIDRGRNEVEARLLAQRIQQYLDDHPGRPVNIVALSAGSGIATWALELLPEGYTVGNVVFLGSSLSRNYDLSAALRHVGGRLYNFHAARDPVLRYGVAITGSVDRESFSPSAAGLYGFSLPPDANDTVRAIYKRRLRNRPYQAGWARYGYRGYHIDATKVAFVRHVVAPLVMQPLDLDPAVAAARRAATTQPAAAVEPAPAGQLPPATQAGSTEPAGQPARPATQPVTPPGAVQVGDRQ